MKPCTFESLRHLKAVASVVVCLAASPGSAADPPRPTPRPGTLAAYAEKITLDRSTLADATGRVILTNDSVTALAPDGSITLGSVTHAGLKTANIEPNNAERLRWQAAHRKQRQVIAALERCRFQIEVEIDRLENQGLTAKILARLEVAQEKLLQLDRDIAAERLELARIVRDARRRGAEPGWFR